MPLLTMAVLALALIGARAGYAQESSPDFNQEGIANYCLLGRLDDVCAAIQDRPHMPVDRGRPKQIRHRPRGVEAEAVGNRVQVGWRIGVAHDIARTAGWI
jgi:hypothetical protein